MTTRVVERLDDWDSRSFTGGLHELEDLADGDFSGVVRAGGAELYMTRGTVVGVERGTIDDFAGASGTVFEAPSPALPLLAVMQAADADVRGKYYSEDTPMAEVDRTLSDGSFTGYVELSDNVLSGDYYLVYHGGQSMAVAFVGNSARLITDDEAFETANDEVGIYKVRQVEVDPIEIPEPEGDRSTGGEGSTETAAAAAGNAGGAAATPEGQDEADPEQDGDGPSAAEAAATAGDRDEGADEAAESGDAEVGAGTEATAESDPETPRNQPAAGAGTGSGADATDGAAGVSTPGEASTGTGASSTSSTDSSADSSADSTTGSTSDRAAQGSSDATAGGSRGSAGGSTTPQPGAGADSGPAAGDGQAGKASSDGAVPGGPTAGAAGSGGSGGAAHSPGATAGGDAADLETRAIPSLDPERTKTPSRSSGTSGGARGDAPGRGRTSDAGIQGTGDGGAGARAQTTAQRTDAGAQAPSTSQGAESAGGGPGAGAARGGASAEGVSPERYEELQAELDDRESEVDRLESELDRVTTEREDLKDQLESAREERDELAEQVDRLESELARLEEELGAATDAERRLTAREALDGTDVFVRYHSKGDATLQKAHDGSVRREDVTDNLRLEKHTQFDAGNVAVGGKNYPEFIEARPEYQFVRWTVEELLFEIRDTGHAQALQVLYDALPQVDRAELNGVIDVTFTEDGQETRTQESFDVILRDRMGNPLLVANLNDSREGATESMMSNLITAAERVGQTTETMAGAFLVTRSFFEPDALETAEEATRSGILSRDKRRSFVNISRKRGFHLCLVEARNQNFHLAVPEL